MKTASFNKGYEAKIEEINGMGFSAARDKLNLDYKPGQKWNGTKEGFDYMQGEAAALLDKVK